MAADESPDESPQSDSSDRDPVAAFIGSLAHHPARTIALGVAVALLVAYAVLVRQELFLVIWLLVVGFLVYLLWRFVRAHERLAGAVEHLVEDGS